MSDEFEKKREESLEAFNAPLSRFAEGEVIGGRYEILRSLGRGGMGMVYLVQDRKKDRQVALKTLLPEFSGRKRALLRFEREVNLARKLDHPCIVKIYDAWKIDDLFMYTMEYIEGESLRHALRKKGRFGLGSTVRIMSMLSHALYHAHQYTIHRDLSPDNVMITKAGNVKLLDFGLAKQVDNVGSFTMVGTNLGKANYNAPEQQLNAREVDKRADIYSMGIMFYELLTGVMPDPGAVKPLSLLRPDLPPACQHLLDTATAKNPDDRYQDARELRKALKAVYDTSKDQDDFETTPPDEQHVTAIFDSSSYTSAPPQRETKGEVDEQGDIVIDVRKRNPIMALIDSLFRRGKR